MKFCCCARFGANNALTEDVHGDAELQAHPPRQCMYIQTMHDQGQARLTRCAWAGKGGPKLKPFITAA